MQLVAGKKAIIEKVSLQSPSISLQQTSSKLLKAYITSKKLSKLSDTLPEHDCTGIILKTTQCDIGFNMKRLLMYVTDESGFLIRIERTVTDPSELVYIQSWMDNTHEMTREAKIWTFCDLKILPFDTVEGCAVATWTEYSSYRDTMHLSRMEELRQWYSSSFAKISLDLLLDKLKTIPVCASVPKSLTVIIGFATLVQQQGLNVTHKGIDEMYQVMIDVGVRKHISAVCPNALLKDLLDFYHSDKVEQESNTVINTLTTSQNESSKMEHVVKFLNELLQKKAIMLQYVLRKKVSTRQYEVIEIKRVCVESLTRLYCHNITLVSYH
jgi:hypothetical protein